MRVQGPKTSVVERIQTLKKIFKDEMEILHGGIDGNLKEKILNQFLEGKTKIIISTTVIEVGIDVPDANIMVIENAERFGLSQLHQLRGRVGRGTKESFCILMHSETLSEISKERLRIITETSDGFSIAESDLKLRGPGDILGLSQTGLPSFTFYDLLSNKELQNEADKYAKEIILQKILITNLLKDKVVICSMKIISIIKTKRIKLCIYFHFLFHFEFFFQ